MRANWASGAHTSPSGPTSGYIKKYADYIFISSHLIQSIYFMEKETKAQVY